DAVDDEAAAALVVLYPVEGVLQGNPFNGNVVAVVEEDELWPVLFRGAHLAPGIGSLPFVVGNFACLYLAVQVLQQGFSLSVDGSFAFDADMALAVGFYQRFGVAAAVVQPVGAAQQDGAGRQVQVYVGLKREDACDPSA